MIKKIKRLIKAKLLEIRVEISLPSRKDIYALCAATNRDLQTEYIEVKRNPNRSMDMLDFLLAKSQMYLDEYLRRDSGKWLKHKMSIEALSFSYKKAVYMGE